MSTDNKRYATQDITDAGTGKSFKLGDDLTGLSPGELANYEHAGIAGDKADAKAAAPIEKAVDKTA